ncbi:hypothetical protein C8Q78DRAFT_1038748 [Trametes maxima]|nr:hypothetical protein C8Q78DRAFT_1038748 [Trametes maxima]
MPASEIDAIFATKGKSSAAAPAAASSSSQAPEKKKKKKKDKSAKRKRDEADAVPEDAPTTTPLKRKVPETVFDPSLGVPDVKDGKVRRPDQPTAAAPKAKKHKKAREEEERFKDSRGTGPRRKTEEGFSIYKEDELGITEQGGDTPLCPFDCQCCF